MIIFAQLLIRIIHSNININCKLQVTLHSPMMESEQIQKTKQGIDQRRQKLQQIKTRLQKKMKTKTDKRQLQQKSNNSKTLFSHFNSNLSNLQENSSSQFFNKNQNRIPSPSVDNTFDFNSTLFKHMDKMENKSNMQNTSSQLYKNADINSYLKTSRYDNLKHYDQKNNERSPRKDYLSRQPQHDSGQVNPASSSLFSQYDKFLQQINFNSKLPVRQIKKHLQKKQGHLQVQRIIGSNNKFDNKINFSATSFNDINNLIQASRSNRTKQVQNRRINYPTNSKLIENTQRQNEKERQKQQKIQRGLTQKNKKPTKQIKTNIKFIDDQFQQSTQSVKIHKYNQSSQTLKSVFPPHPGQSSKNKLSSNTKQRHRQQEYEIAESVDVHKQRLKFMLIQKKKNELSCNKLDVDDSIQYELSQDEEDIANKQKQKQKQQKMRLLVTEKQKLQKQLLQIDSQLAILQG